MDVKFSVSPELVCLMNQMILNAEQILFEVGSEGENLFPVPLVLASVKVCGIQILEVVNLFKDV